MPEWLTRYLPEGLDQTDFLIIAVSITVATFVLSIIAVGIVVVRMPADYFLNEDSPGSWRHRHPFIRWPLLIGKNLLGLFLVALGIGMSFPGVPGQGILTVLIGVMLLNFPGKRRMERWLIQRRGVLRTVNRFRARYGRPPMHVDASNPPA